MFRVWSRKDIFERDVTLVPTNVWEKDVFKGMFSFSVLPVLKTYSYWFYDSTMYKDCICKKV